MTEPMEKLSAYGVPMKEVLERFVDDEPFYLDCLGIFLTDEGFAALGAALDAREYEAAFSCAHNLKGVAGNLGLLPLYGAIGAIVEPLRHKEYDLAGLGALYQAILAERAKVEGLVRE